MRSEQTILFRIELVNLKYCLLTGGIRPDELENIVMSYEPVSIYSGLNQELLTTRLEVTAEIEGALVSC